ncbi:gluconokinase [Marivivens aquimaris]|uniref:gluconokinase n=1 Tax=Marivivens aquimaris TaxID=2774876 RepID=UPI00187F694D|nr:gluconokinase [Marivivens aquimaris]
MRHVLVMGVCGCGKSSTGRAIAQELGAAFVEGDDFHSAENLSAMQRGQPLTDALRQGWLDDIAAHVSDVQGRCVIACSALKQSYRDRLSAQIGAPIIIHLFGAHGLLSERMAARRDHFMPVSLLESQFADLEPPSSPDVIAIDVALSQDAVVNRALSHITSRAGSLTP